MYTIRRGGAYDRFIMMLEAFLERNCEIHCLSLTPIQIRSPFFINHVIRLPFHLTHRTLTKISVLLLFPFYTLLVGWREKIDIFIAFGTLYAFIESIPKWILRKPMVTFIRGSFAFGMQTQGMSEFILWVNRWIEKIGILFSDTILSVNSTIQEEMRKSVRVKKNVRWEVLPNNIPPMPIPKSQDISQIRKKYGIPRDAKVLVTAGVINRGKNIDLLIRSLPEIGLDNLFLLIIGDGTTEADLKYQTDLKKLVNDLKLSDRVVFKGWAGKEELWEIFRCSDLFFLPSKSEGMPNVMLEALGCNLPCLGSHISGIMDILQHEELMFDPSDDRELANKIKNLFGDRTCADWVTRLCEERKRAFSFDWKEKVFQLINYAR